MNFDNRPYLTPRGADGQLTHSEGVTPDMYYACTFEALRETARDLGEGEPYDDEELRQIGDPGSHYGETWATSIKTAGLAYGAAFAADMQLIEPIDLIGTVRLYGSKGWLMHAGFLCDMGANVPPIGPITYSHAERILWADDGGIGMENVEPHPDVYLTESQFLDLYDGGGLLVFKRSLFPVAPRRIPTGDDDMHVRFTIEPGSTEDMPGCFNGDLPSGPCRTYLNLTSEAPSRVGVFCNASAGGAELAHTAVDTGTATPAAGPGTSPGIDTKVDLAVAGSFTARLVNTGAARVTAYVHRENW